VPVEHGEVRRRHRGRHRDERGRAAGSRPRRAPRQPPPAPGQTECGQQADRSEQVDELQADRPPDGWF